MNRSPLEHALNAMDFHVLGPLEVFDGDRRVELPPKLRELLAVLLCERGGTVSAERLTQALWGEARWAGPPKILQVHVHRLRRTLGDKDRIAYRAPGYALLLRPGELDADRFAALVERGCSAVSAGDTEDGAEHLRQALALWRGPAFDGQHEPACVREEATRLSELWLRAVEERIDADLALGRHAEVVGELRRIVEDNPFWERPRARLMLALYRLGRYAEALGVYRDGRRVMVDELGVDPGTELRELEQAVLARDPALDLAASEPPPVDAEPPRRGVPDELPPDVPVFIGRAEELDMLRTVLVGGSGPRVAVVDGPGGVGKSALALRAAGESAEEFPDGRLHVNLHGSTVGVEPASPQVVLGRFLRALSIPSAPSDVEEATALFRSVTAGLRVLVVLDDAIDAAQVRPLLPGGTGSATLVTGRRVLATLDGAVSLSLGPLGTDDAMTLLGGLVGEKRMADEPEAAAEIVRLCCALPLAVRIAGARLLERRDWSLTTLARRLARGRNRLDELSSAELAVRTSLDGSLAGLSSAAARMFALLGVFDGPDLTPLSIEALADGPVEPAFDELLKARLIEPTHDCHRMHDLVRLYARELAETLPEADREAALRRVLHYYLATARRATFVLDPVTKRRATIGATADPDHCDVDPADPVAALRWIDTERENLIVAARQAAGHPEHHGVAIGLGVALYCPLEMRGGFADRVAVARIALDAAERSGDARGAARANADLGNIHIRLGRIDEAMVYHRRALDGWREAGDRLGEAKALTSLGAASIAADRWEESAEYTRRSLAIRDEMGDRAGMAAMLANLGSIHVQLGRFDEAITTLRHALKLNAELGNRRGEGLAAGNLAEAQLRVGSPAEAVPLFERALVKVREVGDRPTEAEFLWYLGEALDALTRAEEAREHRGRAVEILRDIGDIDDETARTLRSEPNPEIPERLRLQA